MPYGTALIVYYIKNKKIKENEIIYINNKKKGVFINHIQTYILMLMTDYVTLFLFPKQGIKHMYILTKVMSH